MHETESSAEDSPVFSRNMMALHSRDAALSALVRGVQPDGSYRALQTAKSGCGVPVSEAGTAYHSLYDPEKEAATLAGAIPAGTFVFFAGLAGAFHVRAHLARNPGSRCIVAEAGYPAFRSLLATVDISDVLADPRVTVIPDCTDGCTGDILRNAYLPVLDGDFRLVPLRSWKNRFPSEFSVLETAVKETLAQTAADYSVQAHFGRLWFRNCLENLAIAGAGRTAMPRFETAKTAFVAAAGPSLEESFELLRNRRDRFVVFATDTAFSALSAAGIESDVIVSIDPQIISSRHVMHPLQPDLTVIMDVCGNPAIARRAASCGCRLVFAAGGHPLARYAALFSPLPLLETGAGTVTIAAMDAARSLGFADIRLGGADFGYTAGKPYCRGTYLADSYGSTSTRLGTEESLYAALMFRTPVTRSVSDGKISYSTDTLERYADFCARYRPQNRWAGDRFVPFPAASFFPVYRNALRNLARAHADNPGRYTDRSDPVLLTLLPFIAWNASKNGRPGNAKTVTDAINLALDLIAGYTGVS